MNDESNGHVAAPERRTVQSYIDETPVGPDGTKLSRTPMTRMQWRIWWLATAGKFFEGMVVFITGVALPLIVKEFDLNAAETGAGFAVSFAKIGAVMTAFLFPVVIQTIGTDTLLYILVGTALLGAFVTWKFRIETTGVDLETV